MKKTLITLLLLSLALFAQAQKAFLFDIDMAVFYPAHFDSLQTLPSMAIEHDLLYHSDLPDSWQIKPVYSNEDGKAIVTIALDNNVDLYGSGLVTGPLKRNNTKIKIWNLDNWGYEKYDGKCLYQSHPWVMGVRPDGSAFGVIADHSWKQELELEENIKFISEGPSFRVVVIERENPVEMIKALGELTGKIELPPLWALGYQQSRFSPSYGPDSKVKALAQEFRKREIPCDVIWMDINYMDNFRIFTFNATDFPNPGELKEDLNNLGFKAGYIIDPGVKIDNDYFVYQQGREANHWIKDKDGNDYTGEVWPGNCHFPDFTRPETSRWWADLYSDFINKGVDAAWNDMNEPGVFGGPDWTMPTDNIHRGGNHLPEGPHLRYHNLYGTLMGKASYEGMLRAQPNKRPFLLSRSNHLGAQRYCATWSGDNKGNWEHMKMSIPMTITLGLSGQPLSGPDVGGYSQQTPTDLFAHWMALSAYYPFSRNHTGESDFRQEPWAFGKKIENVSRTALNRRYKLLPYFYTLFREAAETGVPLMRPVFFADFTDSELRNEEQAFLLGQDLLVIPRWAKNIALPKGDWDILKLEDSDDGYQPLVALRGGAIVPMGKLIQSTDDYATDSITLLVNPNANGTATGLLYDDAGNGFDYRSGDYVLHRFTSSLKDEHTLKVEVSHAEGTRATATRRYRVGYVTDNHIAYSAWTTNTTIEVPVLKDETSTIDLSLLGLMYVGGSFNEWTPGNMPMIRLKDGNFQSDFVKLDAGEYELKFANQPDFSGNDWGNAQGLSGTAEPTTGGGPNIKFTIVNSGNYRFAFNPATAQYTIQPTFNSTQTAMYIGGTFNEWTLTDGEMHLAGDNLWRSSPISITPGNYELKFANTLNFSGNDWGNAEGLTGTAELTTGGAPNVRFTIPSGGEYIISFNDLSLAYSINSYDPSGVSNNQRSKITIYPNPASEVINLSVPAGKGKVEIQNLSGLCLATMDINEEDTRINVSTFPRGMYLVKVTCGDSIVTEKLMLE